MRKKGSMKKTGAKILRMLITAVSTAMGVACLFAGLNMIVFAHNTSASQVSFISDVNTEKIEINDSDVARLDNVNGMVEQSEVMLISAESIMTQQEKLEYKYSEIPLDDSLKNYILEQSERFDIDPDIMFGLYFVESRFDVKVDNAHSTARGLGQILNGTGAECYEGLGYTNTYNHTMAYDPYLNVEMSCWLIRNLQDTYGINIRTALYYYNGCQTYYYSDSVEKFANSLKERERNFDKETI